MWKAVYVAVEFTISAMFLSLPGEYDFPRLLDDSQELMQELSFCMKEA